MSEGYLYHRCEPAAAAQLRSLLATLLEKWPNQAYRYQERLDDIELERADPAWLDQLITDPSLLWPIGRVFCQAGEVRWEVADEGYTIQATPDSGRNLPQSDRYHVQVITENDPGLSETEWDRLDFKEVGDEKDSYLWGERKGEGEVWLEMRIARPLRYPATWSQEQAIVAVRSKTYRQNGVIKLTRLTGVKARPDPKDKEVKQ
jgi:hypothetical protein